MLLRDLFGAAIEKVTEIMETKNPALKGRTDVAEAVGVGAIVFYYLSNNRIKDINFSMEEALSFDGNTGPYVQYTYARACSILEKAGVTDGTPAPAELTLTDPLEKVLCVTLSEFEELGTYGTPRLRAVLHHALYPGCGDSLQPLLP